MTLSAKKLIFLISFFAVISLRLFAEDATSAAQRIIDDLRPLLEQKSIKVSYYFDESRYQFKKGEKYRVNIAFRISFAVLLNFEDASSMRFPQDFNAFVYIPLAEPLNFRLYPTRFAQRKIAVQTKGMVWNGEKVLHFNSVSLASISRRIPREIRRIFKNFAKVGKGFKMENPRVELEAAELKSVEVTIRLQEREEGKYDDYYSRKSVFRVPGISFNPSELNTDAPTLFERNRDQDGVSVRFEPPQ